MSSPIQRIIFGNPGTGKSRSIDKGILPHELNINVEENSADVIKTVFHPEYTYSDFMGKLLPLSKRREDGSSQVEYRFYPGHLLCAIGRAYKNLVEAKISGHEPQNVALVIDEINRGNSSAIFGTAFQLLDRDDDGYSSYQVTLSELEFQELVKLIGQIKDFVEDEMDEGEGKHYELFSSLNDAQKAKVLKNSTPIVPLVVMPTHPQVPYTDPDCVQHFKDQYKIDLKNRQVRLPSNLSIIGTMNTSDNSIYFMDSAFKRRWGWFFYDWEDDNAPPPARYSATLDKDNWKRLVKNLNGFLKSHHEVIRGIEDKQVGYYFIKSWATPGGEVTEREIQSKLMFFVWDSVFQRDKRPLQKLLNEALPEDEQLHKGDLVTFGDFCRQHNAFVNALLSRSPLSHSPLSR